MARAQWCQLKGCAVLLGLNILGMYVPGLRFAPAWAVKCQPFRLQSTFCEPKNDAKA